MLRNENIKHIIMTKNVITSEHARNPDVNITWALQISLILLDNNHIFIIILDTRTCETSEITQTR